MASKWLAVETDSSDAESGGETGNQFRRRSGGSGPGSASGVLEVVTGAGSVVSSRGHGRREGQTLKAVSSQTQLLTPYREPLFDATGRFYWKPTTPIHKHILVSFLSIIRYIRYSKFTCIYTIYTSTYMYTN